jgi:hypothetical protein
VGKTPLVLGTGLLPLALTRVKMNEVSENGDRR